MKYPTWNKSTAIERVREQLLKQRGRCYSDDKGQCVFYKDVNCEERCALGWLVPRNVLRTMQKDGELDHIQHKGYKYLKNLDTGFLRDLQELHDNYYMGGSNDTWGEYINRELDLLASEYGIVV